MCYADIKPANLLLKYRYPDVDPARGGCCDAPPSIRVIDFGCSQMVQEGNKLAKRTGAHCPPDRSLVNTPGHRWCHLIVDGSNVDPCAC